MQARIQDFFSGGEEEVGPWVLMPGYVPVNGLIPLTST